MKRRLCVNFRVDPEVLSRHLPAPFAPRLHAGWAIAGICLTRMEQIRSSEIALHRVAVVRRTPGGDEHAVYVPRQDSDSRLNRWAGGRLFSGASHRARFDVRDDGVQIALSMRSRDGSVAFDVTGCCAPHLPADTVFRSLEESTAFFDPTEEDRRDWKAEPFAVSTVASSYFEDPRYFPPGSVTFDHALVMRDVEQRWLTVPGLRRGKLATEGAL